MMSWRNWVILMICLSANLMLVACGTDTNNGTGEVETEEIPGKTDSLNTFPFGTFVEEGGLSTFGDFDIVVLKTDKTFYMNRVCSGRNCAWQPGAVTGTFKFTKYRDNRYMIFSSQGSRMGRYQYLWKQDEGTLSMLNTDVSDDIGWNAGANYRLNVESPWCGELTDCTLQNLPATCSEGRNATFGCEDKICKPICKSTVITSFKLYEISVEQFTPFVLQIETDGPYQPSSNVIGLYLIATDEQPNLTLFSFAGEEFNTYVETSWTPQGELQVKGKGEFNAKVTSEYSNGWGDTSVNPDDSYYIDEFVIHNGMDELVANEDWDDPRWDDMMSIENNSVDESCLWGVPVLDSSWN